MHVAHTKRAMPGMMHHLRTHWTLAAVIATIAAAAIDPPLGLRWYKVGSRVLITSLFALLGLTLQLGQLRDGLLDLRSHCLIQACSLLLIPTLYYVLVFRWDFGHAPDGVLSAPFAIGLMAALCMPTTTNTSVLFVQQAKGDVAVATLNAAVGNLVGALFSPVLAACLINSVVSGSSRVSSDAATTAVKLSKEIVAPLLCGLAVQLAVARSGAIAAAPRARAVRGLLRLSNVILVCLFYLVFAKAFSTSTGALQPASIAKLCAWVTLWHIAAVLVCWKASALLAYGQRGASPEGSAPSKAPPAYREVSRRITFVLVAPQKTESMAIAILTALFDGSPDLGALTLPIVVWHTVQMIVAALLIPRLRGLAEHAASTDPALADAAEKTEPLLGGVKGKEPKGIS